MKSKDAHVHEGLRPWRGAGSGGPAVSGWQLILKRWPARLFLLAVLLAGVAAWPLACATVVVPPPPPADPVRVYLLDHGRTSSLVIPTTEGGLMRYVYGNWEWYALMRTGVRSGARAMLWPSPAALGRRAYAGPADPASARRLFADWSQHVHTITVSRGRALKLAGELDRRFTKNIATLHANAEYMLDFVRDDEPYNLFHNSNHETAEWLERLGCRVRGPAIYAKWKVTPPQIR